MKGTSWKCVLIGMTAVLVSAWVCRAEVYHMVSVTSPTAEVTGKMAELGLPLDNSRKVGTELEIPLSEADVKLLAREGIAYRIVQEDLEAHYGQVCRDNLKALKALDGGVALGGAPTNMTYGSMGGFYNYNELLASLDKMHQLYPNLCAARVAIGTTGQSNSIWMVKITKNPDANESKPECLEDGVHHAREPGTYTAMLYAMWYLLENYGTDAEATYLVDHRNLYFVPVVNVDGFLYNVQNNPNGGGMWRKNRRNNGDGSYGVDVNRNYPYKWGYDDSGSSPTTSSETYRGPSGGSEPEVRVMMNFVTNHAIRTAMSFHTYQGLCMYPYGYADVQPEHADVFAEYAKVMTVENGYTYGPVCSTIYPANGVTPDWQLHEKDILAFTTEIGTSSFWPAQSLIFQEAKENLRTQLHLFWCAGGKAEVKSVKVEDGLLNAGQTEKLVVAVQNKGWSGSEAVTVEVACTDAYVTVSGGTWTVGALDKRVAGTNSFTVAVAAGCPKGHQVRFNVTLRQGDWVKVSEYMFNVDIQGICDPNESYQYVLITSRAIRDATTTPNVRDLIAHRQARGLTATIVAIEDILGAEYYKGVDDAETLRNFIRDAYNTWKVDFVLLGGDINIIPMRKLYCTDGATDHIPSDLYFQCLDGSYNSNHNDKWGEPTDGETGGDVDLMAEVYVGRASVQNATQMANFVYKTLLYENLSDGESYLRGHLLAGQYLGSQFGAGIFGYGKSYMTMIGHSTNVAGYATLGFDSCPLFHATEMFQWDDDQAGRTRWGAAEMIAQMNSGKISIINHIGHGSYNFGLNIYNTDVAKLTNALPFFAWAEDCDPGGFDQDCLAEHLISENRSGAYAVVMDSRYGWGCSNTNWPTFDGPTLRIHRYFWNSYFGKYKVNLGAMIADGHEDSIWLLNREITRWCIYDTVFFGDPATAMRGRAEEATLAYDSVMTDDTAGNGDGVINPGERAKLWVTLVNVGIKGATGVEATLSCTDSYVTVTDNAAAYGEMPGMGAKKQGIDPYEIQIATNCPTPRQVELVLTVTDGGGKSWTAPFKVMVYTSSQISGTVTLNEQPVSGVTIEYTGPMTGTRLTDSQGKYLFGGIDGTYTLVAKKGDYLASSPIEVTVPPSTSGVNFAFATATISGTVKDALTNTPVSGVTIEYSGPLSGSVQTATNGTYAITRVYGRTATLTLVAKKTGVYFDSEPREVTVPPDVPGVDFLMGTPDIAVAPTSFTVTALWPEVPTRTLTISNRGGSGLKWSIWNQMSDLLALNGAPLAAGEVKRSFAMPTEVGYPYGMAFDGTVLWVSNYGGTLYKLDPVDGHLLGTLDVSAVCQSVWGLAWDGTKLWMVGYSDKKIYAVNPATGEMIKTFTAPNNISPTGVAFGGGVLWVMPYFSGTGTIYKVSSEDGSGMGSIAVPAGISGTLYGLEYFNGSLWMAAYSGDGKVYKLSPADGKILSSFQGPDKSVIDLSSDGLSCLWLVSHGNKKAYLVDSGEATWLREDPAKGIVSALSSSDVTVIFDSVAVGPGVHTATMHVASDDPDQGDVPVSVSFTVTSPITIAGNVTLDSQPLSGATIQYTGPYSGSLQTDQAGHYWFYAGTGTYTVIARKADYLESSPAAVTVGPSQTNVNFAFTTATITGTVRDALTKAVVSGATVVYSGALTGAVQTAADGTYSITRVYGQTATLTLTAKKPGTYFDSEPRNATVPPAAPGVDFTLGIPDIDVVPACLDVRTFMSNTVTRTLTVLNKGGSALRWSIWNQMMSSTAAEAMTLAAGEVKRSFAVPSEVGTPYGTAFDGTVLWVSNYGGTLYKLDPVDGHVVGKLDVSAVCQNVWGLAWDGTKLWLAGYGVRKVYAVDPATGQMIKSFTAPNSISPTGVAFGGGVLWVMPNISSGGTIYKMNPADGSGMGTITVPSGISGYLYGLVYFNGSLWTAAYSGDGKVYKLSPADGKILSSFQGPDTSVMDLSSDGLSSLWLMSYGNKKAYLVDSGEAVWLMPDPPSGMVSSLSSNDVTITFDSPSAGYGLHEAVLHVNSNDPDRPDVAIPVTYVVAKEGNVSPVIVSYSPATPFTMGEGQSQLFQTVVTDADSNTLYGVWKLDGTSVASGTNRTSWTYSPDYNAAGNHALAARLDDGFGGIVTQSWQIVVTNVNRQPVANNQSVKTVESVPVAITLTGSDPDGDALTYSIASPPSNGTLSGTPPAVTYTPATNYSGMDSFTFKANDGKLDSSPGTVTLTVLALRNPENPGDTLSGVDYEYYEGTWDLLPDFNSLTPVKIGVCSNFDISVRNNNDYFGFRFTGFVEVPSNGMYTFYTTSDDGSRLYIGGTLVADNDGLHGMQEKGGDVALRAGRHAITVTMFEKSGGEGLEVRYAGPGVAKRLIPASALFRWKNHPPVASFTASPIAGPVPLTVNLDGSASKDFDGDPISCAWDFGDGSTGSGVQASHTYTGDGSYTVTLTVSDGKGATGTAAKTIFAGGQAEVTFVATNTATRGTWKGVYGSDGYNVIADTVGYPAYAQVAVTGKSDYTWAASTTDGRALQKAVGTDRIAACWYGAGTFDIAVNLTDGQRHRVAVYCLDWDTTTRRQKVEVLDGDTGTVLDSRELTGSFNGGLYLVWDIKGRVKLRMTNTGSPNAVISGLFFDPVPGAGVANITIACDNAYDLYVNGTLAGSGSSWNQSQTYTGIVLRAGQNVIAVRGTDSGGVAGLVADMVVDGKRLGTSTGWKASLTESNGWTEVGFDDSAWAKASDYGAYGAGPWGTGVAGMPADTPAHWIWSSNNDADNLVYFRWTYTMSGGTNGAPTITQQPANTTVTEGQTATFSVTATGLVPLSYQWRKNGAPIGGATSSSYTTPTTALGDNGAKFSVVVTNSVGSVTSSAATLTVISGVDAYGIPNSWKTQYFGSTTAPGSGAMDDPDGDGMTNLAEWKAGTCPTNALSLLMIGECTMNAGSNFSICWSSVTGKYYAVEATTNLLAGFPILVTNHVPGTPPMNSCAAPADPAGQRFYRVAVE